MAVFLENMVSTLLMGMPPLLAVTGGGEFVMWLGLPTLLLLGELERAWVAVGTITGTRVASFCLDGNIPG